MYKHTKRIEVEATKGRSLIKGRLYLHLSLPKIYVTILRLLARAVLHVSLTNPLETFKKKKANDGRIYIRMLYYTGVSNHVTQL